MTQRITDQMENKIANVNNCQNVSNSLSQDSMYDQYMQYSSAHAYAQNSSHDVRQHQQIGYQPPTCDNHYENRIYSRPNSRDDSYSGSTSMNSISVKNFDPKETDWFSYKAYFEQIAKLAGWSDRVKCIKLLGALHGNLSSVILGVNGELHFGELLQRLDNVHGISNDRVEAAKKLASVKQNERESIAMFGERVRQIVYRAYPSTSKVVQERLGLDFFLQGLTTKHNVKFDINKQMFTSFRRAVEYGTNLECCIRYELENTGNQVSIDTEVIAMKVYQTVCRKIATGNSSTQQNVLYQGQAGQNPGHQNVSIGQNCIPQNTCIPSQWPLKCGDESMLTFDSKPDPDQDNVIFRRFIELPKKNDAVVEHNSIGLIDIVNNTYSEFESIPAIEPMFCCVMLEEFSGDTELVSSYSCKIQPAPVMVSIVDCGVDYGVVVNDVPEMSISLTTNGCMSSSGNANANDLISLSTNDCIASSGNGLISSGNDLISSSSNGLISSSEHGMSLSTYGCTSSNRNGFISSIGNGWMSSLACISWTVYLLHVLLLHVLSLVLPESACSYTCILGHEHDEHCKMDSYFKADKSYPHACVLVTPDHNGTFICKPQENARIFQPSAVMIIL